MYEHHTIEQLHIVRQIYVDLKEGWEAYRDNTECSPNFLKTINDVIQINVDHIKLVDEEIAKREMLNG